MRNAIITGATGMLGVSLILKLIERGVSVTALIRPGSARRKSIPEHPLVTIIESDSNDLLSVEFSESYDVFYHFAWKATSHLDREDVLLQQENISGTLDALRLAHRLGCTCFIGAGSQAEYGRISETISPDTPVYPDTAYGISKYAAGRLGGILAKKLGIRYIWTRVFSIYGPHDGEQTMMSTCIRKLKNNEEMQLTPCGQIWDYLYEDDCAEAFALIAEKGCDQSVYCIGSGQAKPLREYVEAIGRALKKEYLLKIGSKPYADNQVMHLQADISSLHKDTGFLPKITYEEALRRML